jgi:hypothetical protein
MNSRSFFLLIVALGLILWIAGCSDDHHSSTGPAGPSPLRITSHNFLPCGSSFVNWQCSVFSDPSAPDSAFADTGLAGANCEWHFGLPNVEDWRTDLDSVRYCEPGQSPRGDRFPNATRAVTWDDYGDYDFYRVASDGYYWLGWDYGAEDTFHLEPQMKLLSLPLTMGTTWTNVYRGWYVDYEDTIRYVDSVVARVDGWGTIHWPYGDTTCLRATAEYYYWEIHPGYPSYPDVQTRYAWLDSHGEFLVDITFTPYYDGTGEVYVTMRMDHPPVLGPACHDVPREELPSGFAAPRHRHPIFGF